MSESLFTQLKNIGIDEELAAQVSASLDPDHNATKKDVLIMQEAILQHQTLFNQKMADLKIESDAQFKAMKAESDAQFKEMKAESDAQFKEMKAEADARKVEADARYYEIKMESMKAYTELKTEIHTVINRQYLVTFGSVLVTITSVLAINWYFQL